MVECSTNADLSDSDGWDGASGWIRWKVLHPSTSLLSDPAEVAHPHIKSSSLHCLWEDNKKMFPPQGNGGPSPGCQTHNWGSAVA